MWPTSRLTYKGTVCIGTHNRTFSKPIPSLKIELLRLLSSQELSLFKKNTRLYDEWVSVHQLQVYVHDLNEVDFRFIILRLQYRWHYGVA